MRAEIDFFTDVLVIGAGLAGICASIAASRLGCSVTLVEKSLVLGGNSGPDAGVHPSGAHRFHTFAAETGIIEELIETAAWQEAKTISTDMHYNSHMLWDGVLYRALLDAGVQVLRSHYARDCVVEDGIIQSVIVEDTGAYRTKVIKIGTAVIESSGDGHIADRAGADWRQGREAKSMY
jgi:flavin-dependent dehydrogenase